MNDTQELTLFQWLQGPMPRQQVLQYAIRLAEALRNLHDEGSIFGNLDPSKVVLTGSEVKLVRGNGMTGISPYMAPEQVSGQAADARSDIFGFGTVVYEMLSGRKPFEGQTPEELKTAILEREPAPLTAVQPELAKLVTKCLAKLPEKRWQRMQKVLLELRLMTVLARHTEARGDRLETVLRAEITDLERRLAARLASEEGTIAELLRSVAGQSETGLGAEVAALESRLASRLGTCDQAIGDLEKRNDENVAWSASISQTCAAMQDSLSGIQQVLKAQASSIASMRTALVQTDDVIERVVDALGALQRSVADPYEANGISTPQEA